MSDIGTIQSTWEGLSALRKLRSMIYKPEEGKEIKRHDKESDYCIVLKKWSNVHGGKAVTHH